MTYGSEFQAIVLAAGSGSRLTEIRGERAKCLLNVGPYPMIWYPLNLLQNHGFREATVVVIESERSEIQQTLEKTDLKIKLDFATIPSDKDFGTADSLKHIYDRISRDMLIISCDIITNANLNPFMNSFREHQASFVSLLLPGGQEKGAVVPGPKSKYKPERDLIGIHPETNRFLFFAAVSDFEERLNLPGHLLRKHGRISIHSRLLDGHVYLLRKWVLDFLVSSKSFYTLKGELLPYIVRKQMSRPKAANDSDKMVSEANVNLMDDDVFNFAASSELEKKITETSLFNDTMAKKPYNADMIRCYAHISPKETFGLRVNTLTSFWAANQKILADWEKIVGTGHPLVSQNATINCTQMVASGVSHGATVSEKTSLKNSIVGPHSVVNPKTRISDSVLMANVTVEEGVVIENCIICDGAEIKKGTVLKSCLIGPGFVVPEGSSHEKAHLSESDEFMNIE